MQYIARNALRLYFIYRLRHSVFRLSVSLSSVIYMKRKRCEKQRQHSSRVPLFVSGRSIRGGLIRF
jgi:hypothetical protein